MLNSLSRAPPTFSLVYQSHLQTPGLYCAAMFWASYFFVQADHVLSDICSFFASERAQPNISAKHFHN